MKIAVDCRSAFKGMGGIGRYTWCLLREYAKADSENRFVCYFTHLEPPGPLDLPPRFEVRRFQAGMIDERFDQLILPSLLKEDDVDLYHNPTFAVPIIKTRARIVSTVHDVVFKRHPELVEGRLAQYLDKATLRAAKTADLILTVSDFSRGEISQLYGVGRERIRVIPNGMTPPRATMGRGESPLALAGLGLAGCPYVLYVGSLEPKKNIKCLLEAFELVLRNHPTSTLKLVLVGGSAASGYPVEEWVKAPGLRGRVVLAGYVAEELLNALYEDALIFVYPSLYEGFGLPPLEAMARGVPTIVSSTSSLPEVVGEDGVCVDPRRPDLFADAISALAADADRRNELSERGRKRASDYTWTKSALHHLEAFKSLGPRRS